MYTTDFAYDGPIFLVPLSLSYPSSLEYLRQLNPTGTVFNETFLKTLCNEDLFVSRLFRRKRIKVDKLIFLPLKIICIERLYLQNMYTYYPKRGQVNRNCGTRCKIFLC